MIMRCRKCVTLVMRLYGIWTRRSLYRVFGIEHLSLFWCDSEQLSASVLGKEMFSSTALLKLFLLLFPLLLLFAPANFSCPCPALPLVLLFNPATSSCPCPCSCLYYLLLLFPPAPAPNHSTATFSSYLLLLERLLLLLFLHLRGEGFLKKRY